MTSLNFRLRIALLCYVDMNHSLVRVIWVMHVTFWSYKISYDLQGHLELWGQLQGDCIFILYRSIWQFITQFLTESIEIFNCGRWKRNFRLQRYYVINIFKLRYLRYLLSGWAQICLSKIRLTICMSCIINLVFNKMEETFQSNTLDWSSLVILSFFFTSNRRL